MSRESEVERVRRWRKNNPEKYKQSKQNWYLSNRNLVKNRSRNHYKNHQEMHYASEIKRRYGILLSDYNRMFLEQGGLCYICGKPEGGKKRLAIDHSHVTGRVRRLLCANCNNGIGRFLDSPILLEKASAYLRQFGE